MNVWAGATGRDLRSWMARVGLAALGTIALTALPSCESGGGGFVGEEVPEGAGETCWQCKPDVEPTPVDCAKAEQGVEFLPVTIYDFDNGAASNMYTYTDNSSEFFEVSDTWQPEAADTTRCINKPDEQALRLRGGPFLNWGGGAGRHLKCLNYNRTSGPGVVKVGAALGAVGLGCDFPDPVQACSTVRQDPADEPTDPESVLARSACPQRDIDFIRGGSDLSSLEEPEEEFLLGMTLDLAQWEGISFWARRGPDSISGFKIGLGDKHTDDDLSFLQYHINPESKRFCERNVECGCPGASKCYVKSTADGGDDTLRCWDSPKRPTEIGANQYLPCGNFQCEEGYDAFGFNGAPAFDALTENTTCQTFAFRGGNQDAFCMNEDIGKVPYERPVQCGDHWVKAVYLSTEWQFYKIPFTELLQEGWAQESHHLDLTTAAVTRFTWSTGWIDFWIDDVRIYRSTHNTTDE